MQDLRSKNWQPEHRKIKEYESTGLVDLLADSRIMSIYAASGEPDQGATFEQIEKRTRLYGKELERSIQSLQIAGIIELREGLYYPKDLHLFLQVEDRSQLLKAIFQKSCRSASERIENYQNDSEMFFTSTLCVQEASLPELKKALREVILKFVDDSVNPAGDRVVRLLTALHF